MVVSVLPPSGPLMRPGPPGGFAERPLETGTIRSLFLDLLGRPPLPGDSQTWIGREYADLLENLLTGGDFWRNWLAEQLYYFLLVDNFVPTMDSVSELPGLLAGKELGVREALHRVCLSSSFDRRNPGPDTFVTVVMEQLLGSNVQKSARDLEIGKKVYDGAPGTFLGKPGSSQADVVLIAISDVRALRHLLRREYERWLRSTPRESDLNASVAALEADALAFGSIVRSWFLSEDYGKRLESRAAMPNRLFVRALYVDLLGRLPTDEEFQRLRSALDGLADAGPLRFLVARLMLDSGKAQVPERRAIHDPEEWIRGVFERLLGRLPDAEEAATFQEALSDPVCRPATVLYAIVSHPEYQSW